MHHEITRIMLSVDVCFENEIIGKAVGRTDPTLL